MQKCMCPEFCRTHSQSETPTNSFYFYMYISVKMALLLVPLTALFRLVTSNLHVEYPWAQSSLTFTSTLRLLALILNTFGLDLEDHWPVALTSTTLSSNTPLGTSIEGHHQRVKGETEKK